MKDIEQTQENSTNNIDPAQSPFKPLLEHHDRYLWALCTIPILSAFISYALELGLLLSILSALIPNIALALLDEKLMKTLGKPTPEHWTVLIIPIYIWQRLTLQNEKKHAFYAWIISLVLSTFIDTASYDSAIADSACEIVTEIVHEQYYQTDTDCVNVEITNKVNDQFYKGVATLSSGKELNIGIDLRKDDYIYVTIN